MQQFLVIALVVLAVGYLSWHIYQLFFAAATNCKGCGIAPKPTHNAKPK